MKNNLLIFIVGVVVLMSACTDPELDPIRIQDLTKGSIIALRGSAVDNLNDASFKGSVDRFSIAGGAAGENFEFDADFLSDDITSLQSVTVFARATQTGTRAQVFTLDGGAFAAVDGSNYPRGSFSIPLSTILTAIGKNIGDFAVNDYIFIECDLTLKDGTSIPASAVVNSSLYESATFYPAHNLRYIAGN
jgi:hypothetical protein